MLAATDIFLPNEREAALISGVMDPSRGGSRAGRPGQRRPDATRTPAPLTVVVKLGADGALAVRGDEALRLPADRVEVVDSTGAGDGFDAGFLYGFLDGRSLGESLALAVACGTLSTRAIGGVDGQATLEEAEALL